MGKKKKKKNVPLGRVIKRPLKQYFRDLDGEDPKDLYHEVVYELEKNLFRYVLDHTEGNQSRAAAILGISRNTLRKKLNQHNLR